MLSRNIRRAVKYGIYGSVAVGGGVVALKLQDGDYENESTTFVRIARTASTAMAIGTTYKKMLYSQEWDRDSDEYIKIRNEAHQIGAEKLLELCKANKGVYIKVGQHVGALDYLLPNEYVKTMQILHMDAPKNSVEDLYRVIKEDLKKDPSDLFDEFSPEPLGTASLAQVHRAKLKDGTVVAVKVQHPFVKNNINLDLRWMEFILRVMGIMFPDFQMQWLIEETKINITKELNFLQEGKNAEMVSEMFSDYKWLKVPKIFWDYSTERVLVMEYVKGGHVNDIKYIEENKIDRYDVCSKLGDLYAHMIFVTGYVHSDPHPGNILLKKDPEDKDVTVFLLDHGLYGQLSEKFRYNYSKLWMSIINRDTKAMKHFSQELGIRNELYGLFVCIVTGRPWESVMKGIVTTKPNSSEKTTFQNEIPKIGSHITQCLQQMDRAGLLVLKTNDLIRSIEHTLGTQDSMRGFTVMARCCAESVYKLDYKKESSLLKKQVLTLRYGWSMLIIYLYSVYLQFFYKVNVS